jgi:hypothetical protein
MLVKVIIVLFMVFILYSLGSALFYLAREKKGSKLDSAHVVKALTWRIGLSLLLFGLLMLAFAMGWIVPHTV